MSSTREEDTVYHPRDAVSTAVNTALMTGTVGLFAATVQNTLQKQNIGAWGVLTKFGGTIALFASVGGAYEFVRIASANLREKDDHWNTTWGGFASGAIIGLRARTFPAVLGYGAACAVTMGVFEYAGGSFAGARKDPNVDEYERRERMRKNYRSPAWETFAELGEGRGLRGPGYEERRRQRIKQNYGIDVPETQPSASPS